MVVVTMDLTNYCLSSKTFIFLLFIHHLLKSLGDLSCNTDVVKVHLQMESIGQQTVLIGMMKMFVQLVKYEGPHTLYSGLMPALVRSVVYGGLRIGLYEPCKYVSDSSFGCTNIMTKLASGAISGSFATALTNPTEVLKVLTVELCNFVITCNPVCQCNLYQILLVLGIYFH